MTAATDKMTPTDDEFVKYYESASVTPETMARFSSVKRSAEELLAALGRKTHALDVLDVGCGAATQCIMWAKDGYRMHGLDINDGLIAIGKKRAQEAGQQIELITGTATQLPWPDASMDVCLAPELLEHVADWQSCLNECARVLRPGGILYISTTNRLCPSQSEFDLPLYSWYPDSLKKKYEKLAVTTRPEIVSHAKYPAVNWFTFASLSHAFAERGMQPRSRFEVVDAGSRSGAQKAVLGLLKRSRFARWMTEWVTPFTIVYGVKQ
jgi:2-polyprenyl-6-hydroxyphenyl methylase/3-demethylubiquinone-9 3-methyltransferase